MVISFLTIYLIRRIVGKRIISGIKESIDRLIGMADQIAIDNGKVQKPKLAHDEIGELGDHLFDMSRQLERNYREINRSRQELEDLAMITAQELRDHLAKADDGLDFILRREKQSLSEKSKLHIAPIKEYISNMQETILAFLEYAKMGGHDFKATSVDLNRVVDNVIKELHLTEQNTPIILNKDNLPKVRGEPKLLAILFHNLLLNAIKYRQQFSELIIDIHSQEIDDNKVRIDIADNSSGLNLNYQQTTFSPFEKLSDKVNLHGSGMGLSICRKVLALHNSNFQIKSEKRKGTRVSFDLDLAA